MPRFPGKGCATRSVVLTQPSIESTLARAREQGQSVRGGRVLRAGAGRAGETAPFGKFIQKEVAFAFTFPRAAADPFLLVPSTRRGRGKLTLSLQNHNGVGQSVLTHSPENPPPSSLTRFHHSNADWLIRWCTAHPRLPYPPSPLTFAPPLVISSSLHPSLLPLPPIHPTPESKLTAGDFETEVPVNILPLSLPLNHNSNIS